MLAGKSARVATRLRGGGSALPGLVVEKVDPKFLATALANLPKGVVVVTGTNGKTTTTKMLVALLRAHGLKVFTNPTGSNFTRGVISSVLGEVSLRGTIDADIAVLELDEAHALHFAKVVKPTHALLLNVARDQLDRFAEIDYTAKLLRQLAEQTTEGVVLNRDDSFVARIESTLKPNVEVSYFGVDETIAERLGELMEQDVRSDDDFVQPLVSSGDGLLLPIDDRKFLVTFADRADGSANVGPMQMRQHGLAAMINATAATSMARRLLGDDFLPATAVSALEAV